VTPTRSRALMVAAWLVVPALVTGLSAPFERMYREVGVLLPKATEVALVGVHALREGWGVIPLAMIIGFALLPLWVAPPDSDLSRWQRLWTVQAIVVGLCAMFAITLLALMASMSLIQCLCPPGCPHQGDGRLLCVGPIALVAVAQARPWAGLARAILAAPRATAAVEGGRVVFLAVPPAALLAGASGLLWELFTLPAPRGLVVPAGVAAAGTATFAVACVAALVRLRAVARLTAPVG
jgi:hypothetical protein